MNWTDLQVTLMRAVARGLSRVGDAHVWLVFAKDLRQPLEPYQAKVAMTVDLADSSHTDELAALYHVDDPKRAPAKAEIYRERLDTGSSCFVARVDGVIVGFNWLRVGTAVGIAETPMVLQDDEVYTTNAYTAHAWRGQGIHPALNYGMLRHAQQQGYRTAYTMARADNARSLVTMQRVGWSLSGVLLCYEPAWAPGELRWFARGSPYPMPVASLASLRVPSLAEIHEQQRFEEPELVKDRPWSKTYRLRTGDVVYYLKIVPRAHAGGLRTAASAARAWPEHAPQVHACNPAFESWMLTRDHGGTDLEDGSAPQQLITMIETYASLQAKAAKDPDLLQCLPSARLDGLTQALSEFLGQATKKDGAGPAGSAFFLGADAAQRFDDALRPRLDLLERHLAPARRLPVTLNHGNLKPGNAALTTAGGCVFVNWTRARSGPAGLSLHAMVGGLLPTAVMHGAIASATDGAGGALLEPYVRTLVRGGYADEDTLRRCLPASITAGAVLDVLYLAGFPMEDADALESVGHRIAARLHQLVELCERLQDGVPSEAGDGR